MRSKFNLKSKLSWLVGLSLTTLLPITVLAQTPTWLRQLGTSGYDVANSVATDTRGNVYTAGQAGGALAGTFQGFSDAWVAKYNTNGNLLWKRQFGTSDNDAAEAVTTDTNDNLYISGTTSGALAGTFKGYPDVWVAKYNTNGNLLWKRQLGTPGRDRSTGATTDTRGNVYISGYTHDPSAKQQYEDVWVAKYDSAGNLLWKRQLPFSTLSYTTGITKDANNNVYISGYTPVPTPLPYGVTYTGLYDAWVVKYDSNGKLIWKRQLETAYYSTSQGVATDSQSNVYVSGETETGGSSSRPNPGETDAWIAKYNSNGNLLWLRQFGTSQRDAVAGVATDNYGYIYVAGDTGGAFARANRGVDAWVAKYDNTGKLIWKRQFGTDTFDYVYSVATDTYRNVYLSGVTEGSFAGFQWQGLTDAWVAKYPQTP